MKALNPVFEGYLQLIEIKKKDVLIRHVRPTNSRDQIIKENKEKKYKTKRERT